MCHMRSRSTDGVIAEGAVCNKAHTSVSQIPSYTRAPWLRMSTRWRQYDRAELENIPTPGEERSYAKDLSFHRWILFNLWSHIKLALDHLNDPKLRNFLQNMT